MQFIKTKSHKAKVTVRRTSVMFILSVLLVSGAFTHGFGVLAATCSTTSECTAKINNLNSTISQSAETLSQLAAQAGSYQNAIAQLNSEIAGLQGQINTNVAEQATLQQQIVAAQAQLVQQKGVLASDVKALYVGGQITPIEMLATSNDLSEYVDKQEAYSAVQNKIQDTLNQIATLQKTLSTQKVQVDQLLASQKSQQAQLYSAQNQQSQLLAYNQDQQSQFNAQIASSKAQKSQLQAQLALLNTPKGSTLISGGTCGGGYPTSTPNPYGVYWGCNHAQDNTVDNWGMDNRECVSYTAFRVHEEYLAGEIKHDMPNWGGVGNAYQWIPDAINAGIPVDQTPHAGDIAIRPRSGASGDVGHAMYVEAVTSSNTIIVSQYNASYTGTYSEVSRSTAGLYFLHFSQWQ